MNIQVSGYMDVSFIIFCSIFNNVWNVSWLKSFKFLLKWLLLLRRQYHRCRTQPSEPRVAGGSLTSMCHCVPREQLTINTEKQWAACALALHNPAPLLFANSDILTATKTQPFYKVPISQASGFQIMGFFRSTKGEKGSLRTSNRQSCIILLLTCFMSKGL